MAKLLSMVVGLCLVLACSSPTGAPVRRLGMIGGTNFTMDMKIEVPDSVLRRRPFDISVRTMGNGCVSFGGTEVQVTGRTVDFRPFDLDVGLDLPKNSVCTAILLFFEHRASVQFDEAGRVTVRLHGLFDSGSVQRDTVILRTVEIVRS